MNRKELKVMGLSGSESQPGSYVVVLSEVGGLRKIPIIVKPNDAQQIAVKNENIKLGRPMTHDLFKTMTDAFNVNVNEVFIHTVAEGIFYTKIVTSSGLDNLEFECSVGDGIVLSLVYNCPIMISETILESAGIFMNDDGTTPSDEEVSKAKTTTTKVSTLTIEDMEKMIEQAIENEDYEVAAQLRDKINKIKED